MKLNINTFRKFSPSFAAFMGMKATKFFSAFTTRASASAVGEKQEIRQKSRSYNPAAKHNKK